ncbi:MAG: tyrosine-type recombinase/integrase [Dehalococcoidia bacterium]|nr:tyrosine-type recombinase/integrase [Dehalococcoidia bacterium]
MARVESRTAKRWRRGMEQLTLRDLIGYWEFHNRTENKSRNTIAWYNHTLTMFERFLQGDGDPPFMADIGEPEVRAYIAYLQQKRKWDDTDRCPTSDDLITAGGIQTRLRALKAFFNWLHREGYTKTARLERLANYQVPSLIVDVLSEEEIRRVLAACDTKTAWGARAYAIITLMLDAGLRLSEVTGLRTADLNLEAGWLKVMGKGSKERIVPFGAAAQRSLWRYRNHYRPEPLGRDVYFFLTLDGRPLGKSGLTSTVKRVAKRSDVTRLHPHLCRHTFATRYLINGGDVFSLQQILGHTTLEMVRRYVNLASAHVAVQHRKYSPMDQLAGTRPRSA